MISGKSQHGDGIIKKLGRAYYYTSNPLWFGPAIADESFARNLVNIVYLGTLLIA